MRHPRPTRLVAFLFLLSIGAVPLIAAASESATIRRPANRALVSGAVTIVLKLPAHLTVDVYLDSDLYAASVTNKVAWNSTLMTNGEHVISVKSYSKRNDLIGTHDVTVTVDNATTIPTPTAVPTAAPTTAAVMITSPGAGSNVQGTISFAAIKSSAAQWMNFYVDGNYVASSPPQGILWDSTSVSDGPHTLSIEGFDSSDNMIANPAINVMVDNVAAAPSATVTPTATPTSKPTTSPSVTPSPSASATPADSLRPSNDIPNSAVPSAAELAAFHIGIGACGGLDDCSYMQKVDGQFTGKTAEIIEQAADKWCPNCTILNPLDGETYSFRDLLKAVAVNETGWYQWKTANLPTSDPITDSKTLTPSHGDLEHVTPSQPNGGSWGLFQIAEGVNEGWPASFPLSARYTGFNADFKVAEQMGVEQGQLAYLRDASRSIIAIADGFAPYVDYTDAQGVLHPASTDVNQRRWGAVGNWYSGGWYDPGAIGYINQVQQILHDQPWAQPGF